MRPLPVLLTRPREDALRDAARLRAGGADRVEVSPLARIAFRSLPALPAGLAVVFTSGNAVAAWGAAHGSGGGRPAWVVGPRTAARAQAAGFEVRGVAADAEALARAIPDDAPPVVHLRGVHARGDLAGALRARGIDATEAVAYAQEDVAPTAAALGLMAAGPLLVPLWSPRAAARLMTVCPSGARANLRPVCLSGAVAAACAVPVLAVAARPDGEAMTAAILRHLAQTPVEGGRPSG